MTSQVVQRGWPYGAYICVLGSERVNQKCRSSFIGRFCSFDSYIGQLDRIMEPKDTVLGKCTFL